MPPSALAILSGIGIISATYIATLISILRVPWIENHAVYMHRLQLIGRKNLNCPEQFGFAYRQVTPFYIKTRDGVKLHTWHVLPLGLYHKNAKQLVAQATFEPTGSDFRATLNFKLLRDDPEAKLVIHTHGSSGALAAYCRPETYRSLSSLATNKIHVLAFDYRGFGRSSGSPTEQGLRIDAKAVFDWATNEAGIPAPRIIVFGQSMGAGVAIALARDLSLKKVSIAGLIITGAFTDVRTMLAEYRSVFGIRPFGLLAMFPGLMALCTRGMCNKWENLDVLVDVLRHSQAYHIQIFHAQDDPIVPWSLSNIFFEHAVKASRDTAMENDEFEKQKAEWTVDMDDGGWAVEWPTVKGFIRQEVVRRGNHDRIMAQPQIVMAVMRAFQAQDVTFGA
jgi:abhydrolase domain-containing protein 12